MTPPSRTEPAPQALIGTVCCDKWRIRRVLGIGGMSTVYEAVQP